jgi:hypothetical protein
MNRFLELCSGISYISAVTRDIRFTRLWMWNILLPRMWRRVVRQTFRRSVLPLFPVSKNKPNKRRRKQEAKQTGYYSYTVMIQWQFLHTRWNSYTAMTSGIKHWNYLDSRFNGYVATNGISITEVANKKAESLLHNPQRDSKLLSGFPFMIPRKTWQ